MQTGLVATAASPSGTTLTASFTVNPSDTSITVFAAFTGVLTTLTLVDDKAGGSHTYTQGGTAGSVASTLTHRIAAYTAFNPVPGTYTLTMTLGATRANRRLMVRTDSGTVAFQDAKNQGQLAAATTTDAVSTSNLTPTVQPAVLIALSISANGTTTYSAGTGFTSRGALSNWDSIGSFSSLLEDVRLTSTSAVPGTFTISSSQDTLSQGIVLTEAITGTIASTLGGATAALAGTPTVNGSMASTLDGASLAAAGTVTDPGTFSATLAGASMLAGGVVGGGGSSSRPYQRLHLGVRLGL